MAAFYAVVALIGAVVMASAGAMDGLGFLSVLGWAVLGAHIAVFVVACILYVIRS